MRLKWERDRYATDSRSLARVLLGQLLVRTLDDGSVLAARIVETEAYLGAKDRASHAFGGRRTARNESMYKAPGTAYVYFTYGMHFCFNVVCGEEGEPMAVLVRAAEPITGIERMRLARGVRAGARALKDTDLCSGPAKLCQAMSIDRSLNGVDMVRECRLFIAAPAGGVERLEVVRTPRIGVDYAGAWAARPLRFVLKGHAHASGGPGGALRRAK